MLVYGDRSRLVAPREALEGIVADVAALAHHPPGLARHARLAGILVATGQLAQGLADAAFVQRGGMDDRGPATDLSQAAADLVAVALLASWRSGFGTGHVTIGDLLDRLRATLSSDSIELRVCEGYAYYALYPELYAEATAALRPPPRIVGLRSIGTSLAAAAAAGCGGASITVRPYGHPFARKVRLASTLAMELAAPSPGGWAVVDEGPGLSGSSFAAMGGFLQAHGVPDEALAYLPSHGGCPGPQAPPERRSHWGRARKLHVGFDEAIIPRLAEWVMPLTGPALAPLEDLSAGQWRGHAPAALRNAPAWPGQERRKFLLRAEAGRFLVKFTGLGSEGGQKLERAERLHRAGFTAEPMGLAHGFLVERWIEGDPIGPMSTPQRSALLDYLVVYFAFRARLTPPDPGATPGRLREMMVRNFDLAGLDKAAALAATLPTGAPGQPAAIDGRLHAWEWRRSPQGSLLKTDALDHVQAHDLIGAQDLAWDVAGACVEFALSGQEGEYLRTALEREAGLPIAPPRVAFQTLAYLAFQLGWWWMAAQGSGTVTARCVHYQNLARRWRPAQ